MLRLEDVLEVVRRPRRAARHRPRRSRRARSWRSSVRAARASRRCCAPSTCSSRSTTGGSGCAALDISDPRVERRRRPRPHRRRLPAVQPLPAPDRARQHHARAAPRAQDAQRSRADAAGLALLERVGLAEQGRRSSRPAVRRSAAARRDRPRDRDRARSCCCSTRSRSALDPELVAEVLDLVRALAADGATIVMATHEMAFARDVARPRRVPRRRAASSSRAPPPRCSASRASGARGRSWRASAP